MSLNNTKVKELLRLSRVIGDISMLSILSAKSPSKNPLFRLARVFGFEIWILLFLLYFIMTSICLYLWSNKKNNKSKNQTILIDFIAIAFKQSIKSIDRRDNKTPLIMIWYFAAFVLTNAFSGALLTFLVFSKPFNKIDSIPELSETNFEVIVFEGENSVEYFNDPLEPYYRKFLKRIRKVNPENEEQDKFDAEILTEINDGTAALVSDQAYLDYKFATKSFNYTNLYRSQQNRLIMPYFIPITSKLPKGYVTNMDKM